MNSMQSEMKCLRYHKTESYYLHNCGEFNFQSGDQDCCKETKLYVCQFIGQVQWRIKCQCEYIKGHNLL